MSFEISRLRRSDRVVALGAVALFIFMFFFKWFGYSASGNSPLGGSISSSYSANAWHSLENTRWLLLLTLIVALGVVALKAVGRELNLPLPASAVVAGLGALAAIFVLYRIIDHPSFGISTSYGSFSFGAKIGLYLAFLACLVIVYGGYAAMTEEGTTLAQVGEMARASFDSVTSPAGASASEPLGADGGIATEAGAPSGESGAGVGESSGPAV